MTSSLPELAFSAVNFIITTLRLSAQHFLPFTVLSPQPPAMNHGAFREIQMTQCELHWHPVHSYAKKGALLYDRNLARSWCRSQRQRTWVLIWQDQQRVNFPRSRRWFRIAYLSSRSGFQEPSSVYTKEYIRGKMLADLLVQSGQRNLYHIQPFDFSGSGWG